MNTAIISIDRELDSIKRRNLFLTVLALNFTWMLFHFTVVYFFTLQLKSVALVWIFLWIWNLFSFLFDIPVWIIQSYFKSKNLYIIACISQIVAMLIFANFIFQISWFITDTLKNNTWVVWSTLDFFLWNSLNIVLLLIASLCYWLSKEVQDVTTISYVLNNANPTQYNSILSKNNVAMWIWSLFWLITSWIILTFRPTLIIFSVIFIIILILFFTTKFFDNNEKTLNLKDVYKFKVLLEWNNLKEQILKSVNKVELKDIISTTKYLFLKPVPLKSWLSIKYLFYETKRIFLLTYKIMRKKESHIIIYWSMTMVLIFWFWDTFASTFMINLLEQLKWWYSYILLWIIAIPAFWLQDYFWKIAVKYWIYKVANFWLATSWISLILLWINSVEWWWFAIMSYAILNSVWYAACISLSQSVFLENYNNSFAEFNNLKEIDANASAAPMKILQNLANVVWLLLWWIILSILDYKWFFIFFWCLIFFFLFWSLKKRVK